MTAVNDIQLPGLEASRMRMIGARGAPEKFSYARAAALLERSAGAALKAHGAKPAAQSNPTAKMQKGAKDASPTGAAPPRETEPAQTNSTATPANAGASDASVRAQFSAGAPAPAGALQAHPVVQAARAPVGAAKAGEAILVRAEPDTKSKPAVLKAPRLAPAPPTARSDFAEILARRLERQTIFDLRLDPPAFGRVEGRLVVEDGGKAVLSLAFDNQAALDFYAGDSAALRLALANTGLDFSHGDFVFILRGEPDASAGEPTPAATAFDPQFLAGFSSGAVDIRV